MPWIFEANIGDTDPPERYGAYRKLNDDIQQILNEAANEGKKEVTFASCNTSAPFTKVCFTKMSMKMKNRKNFQLFGYWSKPGDHVRFSLAQAKYFAMYGDIIGHGPAPTSPVEPITNVASCMPVYP